MRIFHWLVASWGFDQCTRIDTNRTRIRRKSPFNGTKCLELHWLAASIQQSVHSNASQIKRRPRFFWKMKKRKKFGYSAPYLSPAGGTVISCVSVNLQRFKCRSPPVVNCQLSVSCFSASHGPMCSAWMELVPRFICHFFFALKVDAHWSVKSPSCWRREFESLKCEFLNEIFFVGISM